MNDEELVEPAVLEQGRMIFKGKMLALESAGFEPNEKMKKHILKGEVADIPFTTSEWQTWVSDFCIDLPICD